MNSLPVIARELRCEARQFSTYGLRLVAAGAALLLAVFGSLPHWQGDWSGSQFFDIIQPTLFTLIWLVVPIMTCDSISRERREGTLGLLLLTPLRPMDVCLAKACSGVLRSLTVVLAVLPLLAIVLLMGGVSRTELLRAGLTDTMALLGATAAGLLASSRCRQFNRAAVLALSLSVVALLILGNMQAMVYMYDRSASLAVDAEAFLLVATLGPWVFCAGMTGVWRSPGRVSEEVYLWVGVAQVLAAALLLRVVLAYLDRHLRRLACEGGRSRRQEQLERVFCTPVLFTGWLARHRKWQLNRNPIGWLQRRTWSARLSTWSWLAVLTVVATALVLLPGDSSLDFLPFAVLLLGAFACVGVAFSAAGSFRAERETGAMELLLVTPMCVGQIITGRLFGLWVQYLPALALLIVLWSTSSGLNRWVYWSGGARYDMLQARFWVALLLISTFLLLPVIGLQQSMVRKHFITAWMATLTVGVLIPLLLPTFFFNGESYMNYGRPGWGFLLQGWEPAFSAILIQAALALRAAWRLYRNLGQRQFATQST